MEIALRRRLDEIQEYILRQETLKREVLSLADAASYTGLSKSCIYKLTSKRQIPFYRPLSKLIFFKRSELDAWMVRNRCPPQEELSQIDSAKGSLLKKGLRLGRT